MSTNINLKNSTDTTFSITHSDGANTKVLDSKDIAVAIDTVADFPANPNNGDVVIVRDLNRGGTFIYDSSEVAGSNDGTNFDGWIRQYSGAVNVTWFGAKGDGTILEQSLLDVLASFNDVHFPYGVYNFGSNQLSISLSNSKITCDAGTILKSTNNDAIIINAISELVAVSRHDNMPIYQTRPDWNDADYGGLDPSWTFIHNVHISGFIIEIPSSGNFGISIFKGKGCTLDNLTVRNIGGTLSNGIRAEFCKDLTISNCTIEESLAITYGIFVYWSYNTLVYRCNVYKVLAQGIELKHGVNSVVEKCNVYGDYINPSYGIDFPYGSINCTAKDCSIIGASRGYSSGSSYEFDYTVGQTFSNCYADVANDAFLVERNSGLTITNCSAKCSTFISAVPFYYAVGSTEHITLSTTNTKTYEYDGQYDFAESTTYGTKYYEYRPYPALINSVIENCEVVSNSSATVFFHTSNVIGDFANLLDVNSVFKKSSTVRTSSNFYNEGFRTNLFKAGVSSIDLENNYYLRSWDGVRINNISIKSTNATAPTYGIFSSRVGAFNNVSIKDIKIVGSVGKFINCGKIDSSDIKNIEINSTSGSDTQFLFSSAKSTTISNYSSKGIRDRILQFRNNETGVEVKDGYDAIRFVDSIIDMKGSNAVTATLFATYLGSQIPIKDVFMGMKNISLLNILNESIITNYMYHNSTVPTGWGTYNSGVIASNVIVNNRELTRRVISASPAATITSKRHYIGEIIASYDAEPSAGGIQNATYIATSPTVFTKI